mgnify:CR=1 FL=1
MNVEFTYVKKEKETLGIDGISIDDSAENIVFKGVNFTYTFDKKNGLLTSLVFKEKEYLVLPVFDYYCNDIQINIYLDIYIYYASIYQFYLYQP